ncbi:nucleoside triphosphate pyrophosphohydrolase family protein [Xanthomonas campestris pv. campestris]|nr:nucleoside triphosphate pyrophosphohydrolase family protein [Xanthomonas campestris]MCF8861650.1 nucleoside triphosphate pyrophosphohydrolase family protein [Xanthomonas campestris pv. campestris]
MLETFTSADGRVGYLLTKSQSYLEELSKALKETDQDVIIKDRIEFLDSIADQIVTAVGAGQIAGMDVVGALNEVNRSNFSKFDSNGNPILDNNRKIIKSKDYSKPDLTPFV